MKYDGVEDTLFIPLAASILISEKYPKYFLDEKSLELKNLEQVININKNKDFNIISLGVGLETMNYRIKDNNNKFYSIDFDKVIDLKLEILGKKENETLIKSDI